MGRCTRVGSGTCLAAHAGHARWAAARVSRQWEDHTAGPLGSRHREREDECKTGTILKEREAKASRTYGLLPLGEGKEAAWKNWQGAENKPFQKAKSTRSLNLQKVLSR